MISWIDSSTCKCVAYSVNLLLHCPVEDLGLLLSIFGVAR